MTFSCVEFVRDQPRTPTFDVHEMQLNPTFDFMAGFIEGLDKK
jgi:hypothetical protein